MISYLPLIGKNSIARMDDLTVYVKERHPFAPDLSLENSTDCYLYSQLNLFHPMSYLLFFYR